jgi:hypothetical protein
MFAGSEGPLLEAVTRKRLLKTLRARGDFVSEAVICKVWRLVMSCNYL